MLVFSKVWRDTFVIYWSGSLGALFLFLKKQFFIEVVIAIANPFKSMFVSIFLGHRIANNENIWKKPHIFLAVFPIVEARSFSNDYEQNNKQENEINRTASFAWEDDWLVTGQVRPLDAIVFHVHDNPVWGKLFNVMNLWELFSWCHFKQLVPYKLRDFFTNSAISGNEVINALSHLPLLIGDSFPMP